MESNELKQLIKDEIKKLLSSKTPPKIGDRVKYMREVTAGLIEAYGVIKEIVDDKALVDKDQGINARKDWVKLNKLKKL